MKNSRRNNMQKLLSEREEFLVIGMTGRVGSGCSEAADILTSDIDALIKTSPDKYDCDKRILWEYAKSHWISFDVIKVRTIIATFLLYDMREFAVEILNLGIKNGIGTLRDDKEVLNELVKAVKRELWNKIRDLYEEEPFELVKDMLVRNRGNSEDWRKFEEKITYIKSKLYDNNINYESLYRECIDFASKNKIFSEMYKENLYNIKYEDHNNYLKNVNKCVDTFSVLTAYIWIAANCEDVYGIWTKLDEINTKLDEGDNFERFVFAHDIMPAIVSVIHEKLCEIGPDIFTVFFQRYGNCIRRCGKIIYNGAGISEGYDMFEIPRKINLFIKILRHPFRKNVSRPEKIVIDAIKNPFEAFYLKERYSAFYLLAISADEEIRVARLENSPKKKLNKTQIHLIDWNEYSPIGYEILTKYKRNTKGLSEDKISFAKKVNGDDGYNKEVTFDWVRKEAYDNLTYQFILQDVENCIQIADVFISNRSIEYSENNQLKWDIIRNVCLMLYPGLVQPTPIERCMQIAFSAKANSGCISRQVGAVVTDSNYNILSIGWNDVPCGDVSCSRKDLGELCRSYEHSPYTEYERDIYTKYELEDEDFRQRAISRYGEMSKSIQELCGLPMRYCFKDVSSDVREPMKSRAMHGEEKALAMCSSECEGGYLFTTSSPCEMCAKNAKNRKIKNIYYIEPYPALSENQYSNSGDINNRADHILFTGAVGRAYTQMYTPLMQYKDVMANLRDD